MKKLMILAATAAIAGVASAVEVYDYRSSVKHTYLRERAFNVGGARQNIYVKYTKSSTLTGYLVQDYVLGQDGVLDDSAAAISRNDLQPGNRCFLVVQNRSAEARFRFPRIIPGVIEAKWYNSNVVTTPSSFPAQGIIYLGGEILTGAYAGTTFNALDGIVYAPGRTFADWQRRRTCNLAGVWAANVKTATIGIDDYWFTSCFLFGMYNQPSWRGAVLEEFSDAWMNLAGLGRARFFNDIETCCGQATGNAGVVLDTLNGSVKAGFYLCSENGDNSAHTYLGFRHGFVEDQLWLDALTNDDTIDPGVADGVTYAPNGVFLQKIDLWTDGNLDTRSTDVGYGTFTLRRTTRLNTVALTDAERNTITTTWALAAPAATTPLLEAIKGAMLTLDRNANLFGNPVRGNNMINYSFYLNYLAQ